MGIVSNSLENLNSAALPCLARLIPLLPFPSGTRYKRLKVRTTRVWNSFFLVIIGLRNSLPISRGFILIFQPPSLWALYFLFVTVKPQCSTEIQCIPYLCAVQLNQIIFYRSTIKLYTMVQPSINAAKLYPALWYVSLCSTCHAYLWLDCVCVQFDLI